MIVGTFFTGLARNGPENGYCTGSSTPADAGTHEGCIDTACVTGSVHFATLYALHPYPGPAFTPGAGIGIAPVKSSCDAATTAMCPPNDGLSSSEKVRSDTTYLSASAASAGTCDCS